VSFFGAVLNCVVTNDRRRGAALLSRLTEPEETRLGVSKGHSRGRGIGELQASDVFEAMARSAAARTGLLEDLADFALFVPGIGRDKVSDMTTNIIRAELIKYTQAQCRLHGVPMREVSSGFCWDVDREHWYQEYVQLPVYEGKKIILVPKFAVRYQVGVDAGVYRRDFVLEYLMEEHRRADDALVTAVRNRKGVVTKRVVYKKTVDAYYPKDKDFLAEFSKSHPEVIDRYRESLKLAGSKIPELEAGDGLSERDLAAFLSRELLSVPSGRDQADEYHALMVGIVSFIFFPDLIYPQKEVEINQGRKRIDITYTNGKVGGFFYRMALDQDIKANVVHVECKNYSKDIANPELDQLLGRFDRNRGKLGLMLFRGADDVDLVRERCRDAARQSLGIVLPMNDDFILCALERIARGERDSVDVDVDRLYRTIIA
jgi:hypothetical protein